MEQRGTRGKLRIPSRLRVWCKRTVTGVATLSGNSFHRVRCVQASYLHRSNGRPSKIDTSSVWTKQRHYAKAIHPASSLSSATVRLGEGEDGDCDGGGTTLRFPFLSSLNHKRNCDRMLVRLRFPFILWDASPLEKAPVSPGELAGVGAIVNVLARVMGMTQGDELGEMLLAVTSWLSGVDGKGVFFMGRIGGDFVSRS